MKPRWKWTWSEGAAWAALGLLAAWMLHGSWRKWADPIIDSGPQFYNTWQVSLGALPYHDLTWNYGPLSLLINAGLFKLFGPGIMILAGANLAVYGAVVFLLYIIFRKAWGAQAAFAALAVFIGVFSFSMINDIGNYNYALPYSNETTLGLLVLLLTIVATMRWNERPGWRGAFWLGLGGGTTAVLKPEFMLAAGGVGILAVVLRWVGKKRLTSGEVGSILLGMILPTALLAIWFARRENYAAALFDCCHGWWLAFASQVGTPSINQSSFMGFNQGGQHAWWELTAAITAVLIIGPIVLAGWMLNTRWPAPVRITASVIALAIAFMMERPGFDVGPAFPVLMIIVFAMLLVRAVRERRSGSISPHTGMQLALTVAGGLMLVRMILRARINHFGFIQAALAGMVLTAFIVAELPNWLPPGRYGRTLVRVGVSVMLILTAWPLLIDSAAHHAAQTQPVGSGRDLFYAFDPERDDTGAVVNWCAEKMFRAKPDATLLVLPEGVMINYLSRHNRPMPEFREDEDRYIAQLQQTPPDYVIVIWGDRRDGGFPRFGDPGQAGEKIGAWLNTHYAIEDKFHGNTRWAFVMHKKSAT